ncbi:hypothetical protein INR49_010921 [Caranx melampygus]|nr:hypothetical protein INR49_010921 [Caranx melampygus]
MLVNFRAQIAEQQSSRKQGTNMKEGSGVSCVWRAVLVGLCVLLLLSSAGLVFVLVRQRELTEELFRLDAQMQELSQSCKLQAGVLFTDRGEAAGRKTLHRSRRNQEEEPTTSEEKKDALMLMSYTMVPVKSVMDLCKNSKGLCLTGPPGPPDSSPRIVTRESVNETHTGNINRTTMKKTESPTPHSVDEARDVLNVTYSEKPLDSMMRPGSFHPDNTLSDTNTGNTTEAPVEVSPDFEASPEDTVDESNTENITGTPILTDPLSTDQSSDSPNDSGTIFDIFRQGVSPTPTHSDHEDRDTDVYIDKEADFEASPEDTVDESNTENITGTPILTDPLSTDQSSDSVTDSGAIIDIFMQRVSPTPTHSDHEDRDTDVYIDKEAEFVSAGPYDRRDTWTETSTEAPVRSIPVSSTPNHSAPEDRDVAVDRDKEAGSFYPDNTLSDTNTGNTTEAPVEVSPVSPTPTHSDHEDRDADVYIDKEAEFVSAGPYDRRDTWTETSTEAPVRSIPVSSTPNHSAPEDRDVAVDRDRETGSFYPDNTLSDTNTGNTTEAPVEVSPDFEASPEDTVDESNTENITGTPILTAPLSTDQSSDSVTDSGAIFDIFRQGESPTSHPDDNSSILNASDSNKLEDTTTETESVSFHQGVSDVSSTFYNTTTGAPNESITDSSYLHQMTVTANEKIRNSECSIKSIKCSERATNMITTYGAWMSDASWLDDRRYWIADHFSGRICMSAGTCPLFKAETTKL